MGIYINPTNEMFATSLRSEIYVDKSGMIDFMNRMIGTRQAFLCVSRPRRFGKTMGAEMLAAYYCCEYDSHSMFDSLEIASLPSYEAHINKYDVVMINMADFLFRAGNVGGIRRYTEQKLCGELKRIYPEYTEGVGTEVTELLTSVYQHTDRKFVFIIDEWDCVFRTEKEDSEAQKQYLDFLRDLFKDKAYIGLAYMTGILPIKKYGVHSALNMFSEFSMTNPRKLAKYVGFTEDEVKALCEQYRMDFAETRRWYDGYRFKNAEHIYSPKSVVDAMLEEEFESYWTNTETYEALKIYIEMNYDGLKDDIIRMIAGEQIVIDNRGFQNDMTTFSDADDVLTLLVHLGYLGYDSERKTVFIPNEEVRGEFITAVKNSGWSEVIRAIKASDELLEAIYRGDENAVAEGVDAVHMDTTSILNYNNENSLSCVISLAFYSARNYYFLIRELPTGKGFADIVFLPRKNCDKPAIIIELKWNSSAEGAIAQIKEKKYIRSMEGYSGDVILTGINYDKERKTHSCVIEYVKV